MTPSNSHARATRAHSLYRAVLSLTVAALIAASIPFAAIYVSTLHRPPVLPVLAPSAHGAKFKLITTASGKQIRVPVPNGSSAQAIPITTRTSGASGAND